MNKEFDKWNVSKKEIHQESRAPFYKEREIWWCSLGINIGYEIDGTGKNFDRPILVVKGFNKNTFLGIALTGKKKEGKYYLYLGEIEGRETSVVLSQLRLIDSKRLVRKLSTLSEGKFREVKERLKNIIFNP